MSKELKNKPTFVEWSPDNKNILIGTDGGAINVFDENCKFKSTVVINCLYELEGVMFPLAALEWYDSSKQKNLYDLE